MPSRIIILPCNKRIFHREEYIIRGFFVPSPSYNFNASDELRHLNITYRSPLINWVDIREIEDAEARK